MKELLPPERRNTFDFNGGLRVRIEGLSTDVYEPRIEYPEDGLNILGMQFLREYHVFPEVEWTNMTWRFGGGRVNL